MEFATSNINHKFVIKFKDAPYEHLNNKSYEGHDANINAVLLPCHRFSYSDSYFSIVSNDVGLYKWYCDIYNSLVSSMSRKAADASLEIFDEESDSTAYYDLTNVYPIDLIEGFRGSDFIIRFTLTQVHYNKRVSNKDDKNALIEKAGNLIETVDSIDNLMKSNDELYSSGVLKSSEACPDLDNLLMQQKDLCYRRSVDLLRDIVSLYKSAQHGRKSS